MRSVFINNDVFEKALKNEGYVIVRNLLNKQEVKSFLEYSKKQMFDNERPFISTNYSDDKPYRRKIFQTINKVVQPKIDKIVDRYEGICGAFFLKKARKPSQVGLHFDWQMVEEPETVGVNVWIPLVNANRLNGCVKVIPGSHKKSLLFRGPHYIGPAYLLKKPIKRKYCKSLPLKAGDAIIFDNRLLSLFGKE